MSFHLIFVQWASGHIGLPGIIFFGATAPPLGTGPPPSTILARHLRQHQIKNWNYCPLPKTNKKEIHIEGLPKSLLDTTKCSSICTPSQAVTNHRTMSYKDGKSEAILIRRRLLTHSADKWTGSPQWLGNCQRRAAQIFVSKDRVCVGCLVRYWYQRREEL